MKALVLALTLLPLPALAETGFACAFTVSCEAAGGCEPAQITTEIGAHDENAAIFLTANSAAIPATRLSAPDRRTQVFVAHEDGGSSDLITIHADGTALHSTHSLNGDARAVTYFGSCEEM